LSLQIQLHSNSALTDTTSVYDCNKVLGKDVSTSFRSLNTTVSTLVDFGNVISLEFEKKAVMSLAYVTSHIA